MAIHEGRKRPGPVPPGGPTRFVKIYGLQRSGTNWVKFLLERNFDDTIAVDLPLGNKHELPRPAEALREWRWAEQRPVDIDQLPYRTADLEEAMEAGELAAALVVKPLLPWLISYHRYRRLKERDRYPQLTPGMAGKWSTHWLRTNAAFVSELPALGWRCSLVDYASLLADLAGPLRGIQRDLGLRRGQGRPWVSVDRAMRRSTDAMHGAEVVSDRRFDPGYYADQAYLAELSEDLLVEVRRAVAEDPPAGFLAGLLGFGDERNDCPAPTGGQDSGAVPLQAPGSA